MYCVCLYMPACLVCLACVHVSLCVCLHVRARACMRQDEEEAAGGGERDDAESTASDSSVRTLTWRERYLICAAACARDAPALVAFVFVLMWVLYHSAGRFGLLDLKDYGNYEYESGRR